MTVSSQRTKVALNLPGSAPAIVLVARTILEAMTANPSFPAPEPALSKVAAAVEALQEAQVAVQTRKRGTVEARDERLRVVVSLLERLKAYVQGEADDNWENAVSIIEGARMGAKKKGSPSKAPLSVAQGTKSGTARLEARSAGDRATYQRQWSADGGKTWLEPRKTLQSHTVVRGLPVGTRCLFRLRAVTAKMTTNWSEPVALRAE